MIATIRKNPEKPEVVEKCMNAFFAKVGGIVLDNEDAAWMTTVVA